MPMMQNTGRKGGSSRRRKILCVQGANMEHVARAARKDTWCARPCSSLSFLLLLLFLLFLPLLLLLLLHFFFHV